MDINLKKVTCPKVYDIQKTTTLRQISPLMVLYIRLFIIAEMSLGIYCSWPDEKIVYPTFLAHSVKINLIYQRE